jgi:hypothetical protein
MVEESNLATSHGDDDALMLRVRVGGPVDGALTRRMESSVSSLNDTESSSAEWNEESNITNNETLPGKFRRRMSSLGSSTHSSTHCSDSMTSFLELEIGSKGSENQKAQRRMSCNNGFASFRSNDSKSLLNESLTNWNSEIQVDDSDDEKPLRLNSSLNRLVALTKSTSEHVLTVNEPKTRRRMSMLACVPSQMTSESKSFRSCFKETVNDWNSELPVDSDEECAPLNQLNLNFTSSKKKLSCTKGVKTSKSSTESIATKVACEKRGEDGKSSRRSLLSPTHSTRRLVKTLSNGGSETDPSTTIPPKKEHKKEELSDSRSGRSNRTSSSSSTSSRILRGISSRAFMSTSSSSVDAPGTHKPKSHQSLSASSHNHRSSTDRRPLQQQNSLTII